MVFVVIRRHFLLKCECDGREVFVDVFQGMLATREVCSGFVCTTHTHTHPFFFHTHNSDSDLA